MPSYQSTLVNLVRGVPEASPGLPVYLFGGRDYKVAPTKMNITNVALTSNVATLTVAVIEGNLPIVGQLVSTSGVSNSVFNNLTNKSITAVSFTNTPEDGKGTISFALTHADVVSAAATGRAVAFVAETTDALANGASLQVSLGFNVNPENGRTVRTDVNFPSLPTSVTVKLQGAAIDEDSQYVDIATVATVAGSAQTAGPGVMTTGVLAPFLRLNVSSATGGTNPTIIGKITV